MSIPIHEIKYQMIQYFGKDIKRINHALKVHSFAHLIATNENIDSIQIAIIETVALLHDIGIKQAELKYNSSAGKFQEQEGPAIAQLLLKDFNLQESFLNRVLYLIGHHHSYQKMDGIDFQILVESDFIVNIQEDNLSSDSIRTIQEKYFKTSMGHHLLKYMFLS